MQTGLWLLTGLLLSWFSTTASAEQSSANIAAWPGSAEAPAFTDEEPVVIDLYVEHAKLQAGGTSTIAVRFRILDGWHLYFPGHNETGFAPKLTFDMPEGAKVGETIWPAPIRYITNGDTLDHVYEHELVVLTTVNLPKGLEPGEIEIGVSGRWLVCRDVCQIGFGEAMASLTVGSESRRSVAAPAIERVRARMPKPIDLGSDEPQIGVRWSWGKLRISGPREQAIAVYPFADAPRPKNMQADARSDSGRVSLSFESAEDRQAERTFRAFVEVGGHARRDTLADYGERKPAASTKPADDEPTEPRRVYLVTFILPS